MAEYKPPYTISDKMLELVSEISEKIGEISAYKELSSKPHLRKNNRINSIHSSLKIEANSLSLSEVRDVINGRIVLGDQKEIQEVKNAYAAYAEIGKADPYNINELKRIHGVMTYLTVSESGHFRKGNEGVFSEGKCIFVAPPPEMVPSLMDELFVWMKNNKGKVHPLILSAVFHYEFVFIHPFADGNGRMARLWHTIILSKWKPVFEYIPLESQIEKFQSDYYNAISICHKNGNSDVFIEFILEKISEILNEAISQIVRSNMDISEYVKKMTDLMEYDVPYTAVSLMDLLGLRSRETFRKNYMDPALNAGIVQRTIPDKPNSKNQRYVKK